MSDSPPQQAHLGSHLQAAHLGEGSMLPHALFGVLDSLIGAKGSSVALRKAATDGVSPVAVFGESHHTLAAAQQQVQGNREDKAPDFVVQWAGW